MKKTILTFITLGVAGLALPALAQTDTNAPAPELGAPSVAPNGPAGEAPPMPPDANTDQGPPDANSPDQGAPDQSATTKGANGSQVILPSRPFVANRAPVLSDFMPPATGTNVNEIRLNFRNAPLEMVLNYLSDAAGFIIVLDTPVHGNVSVISSHPVTRDEAVNLLNQVLNQNGYAAIRNDERTLTILDKNDAKTRDIPVRVSNNPDEVPKNDEIVTQIIPIRFVDAGDLVKDLSSFVSPQATVVANDAGNSIVITDTQSNIRHLMQIIKAIDSSAEAETEIRVFPLKYANPTDIANELGSVFQSNTSGSGNSAATTPRFGGGNPFSRFFGGGGFGGNRGGGNSGSSTGGSDADRIKKATQVTAVADSRIQAVIVTAPKDMMAEIANMMQSLDVSSDRDQDVYVFHLNNADPYQALQVLQNMFQSSTASRNNSSSSSQSPFALRAQNTATATSSSSTTTSSSFGSGGSGARGGQ
ncbi:MAG TPA: secretin N-terminal domain-containing protein [Verrucomicrobiae bacterium]|jgi:general secretion pathway protein D